MTENMVSFNEETGQYDLPAEARQQLQFAAEQLGVSKDNMIDLAIQSSKIKDIKSGPGTLRLTLTMKDDLSLGSIQLLFSDRPMQLRQWTIRDQQGIEVRVSLMDMQRGARLNPKLFEVDPNLFSNSNRQN